MHWGVKLQSSLVLLLLLLLLFSSFAILLLLYVAVATNTIDKDESCKIQQGCFLLLGLHGVVLFYLLQFIHPSNFSSNLPLCFGCSQSTPTFIIFLTRLFFFWNTLVVSFFGLILFKRCYRRILMLVWLVVLLSDAWFHITTSTSPHQHIWVCIVLLQCLHIAPITGFKTAFFTFSSWQ